MRGNWSRGVQYLGCKTGQSRGHEFIIFSLHYEAGRDGRPVTQLSKIHPCFQNMMTTRRSDGLSRTGRDLAH